MQRLLLHPPNPIQPPLFHLNSIPILPSFSSYSTRTICESLASQLPRAFPHCFFAIELSNALLPLCSAVHPHLASHPVWYLVSWTVPSLLVIPNSCSCVSIYYSASSDPPSGLLIFSCRNRSALSPHI